MGKSDAKGPQNQPVKCRFSLKQYMMLKRCSEKKDITEWNEWRKANPNQEILLEGAALPRAHLKGADLAFAHLKDADLGRTHLECANLEDAHLENADFLQANVRGASLCRARLKGADLTQADLQDANLWHAHLAGASLLHTNLQGANLLSAHIEGTRFWFAAVDGKTLIDLCQVNRATDFMGVGLDQAGADPGLKQLLEYNVRRLRWREWYDQGNRVVRALKRASVQLFWLTSDYGRSTKRILGVFFGLAVIFAVIYRCLPGCLEVKAGGELRGFVHALYFSVVTMTTLGFGDIHANPGSVGGQLLLMGQVILGYVLLGALVTRFAVLFQAGGPSAKFPDERTWKKRWERRWQSVAPLVRPYARRARVSFCARNRIGRPVLRHALRLSRPLRNRRRLRRRAGLSPGV